MIVANRREMGLGMAQRGLHPAQSGEEERLSAVESPPVGQLWAS